MTPSLDSRTYVPALLKGSGFFSFFPQIVPFGRHSHLINIYSSWDRNFKTELNKGVKIQFISLRIRTTTIKNKWVCVTMVGVLCSGVILKKELKCSVEIT